MEHVIDYAPPEPRRVGRAIGKVLVPIGLLFGYWIAWVLGPLSIGVALIVAVGGLWQVFRRKWNHALFALAGLLVSPMAVSVVLATSGYFAGTATLRGMGLSRVIGFVDPATRLQHMSGGCLVMGNEWMIHEPNNFVLLSLTSVLGRMPGSYDGPYPDEATSFAAIAGAATFDLRQLPTDRITVSGVLITLRPGQGEEILRGFQEGPAMDVNDTDLLKAYGEAHATLIGGRCLVLEIPAQKPGTVPEHRSLVLIDVRTGRVFAYHGQRAFMRWVWH